MALSFLDKRERQVEMAASGRPFIQSSGSQLGGGFSR